MMTPVVRKAQGAERKAKTRFFPPGAMRFAIIIVQEIIKSFLD
jgi:hypothetical protein